MSLQFLEEPFSGCRLLGKMDHLPLRDALDGGSAVQPSLELPLAHAVLSKHPPENKKGCNFSPFRSNSFLAFHELLEPISTRNTVREVIVDDVRSRKQTMKPEDMDLTGYQPMWFSEGFHMFSELRFLPMTHKLKLGPWAWAHPSEPTRPRPGGFPQAAPLAETLFGPDRPPGHFLFLFFPREEERGATGNMVWIFGQLNVRANW